MVIRLRIIAGITHLMALEKKLFGGMVSITARSVALLPAANCSSCSCIPRKCPAPTMARVVPVVRPAVIETTALGAALLAGLAAEVWPDMAALGKVWRLGRRFEPVMPQADRDRALAGWRRAVERARSWVERG